VKGSEPEARRKPCPVSEPEQKRKPGVMSEPSGLRKPLNKSAL